LRNPVREALTRTVWTRDAGSKRFKQVRVEPSQRLLMGIYFSATALIGLIILEIAHMALLGSWNAEVFAGITLIIGTILGAFFGQRG